ncbi:MAG: RNA polymerase sigma factor [Nocardioides sp.]|jgi:RNA polymerase sigma-70 factor (ECF subfamily)
MVDAFWADFLVDMLPKVHRFIRARFKAELAEDLASDTLVTLLQKQVSPPKDESELLQLRSLTYKIAARHISNAEKKARRQAKVLEQGMLRVTPGVDPTYEAVVPLDLAAAIAQLDFNDRQAVNLMIAGFRTAEIAEILGITAKAASMRLARARERLSQRLAEGNEVDDVTA